MPMKYLYSFIVCVLFLAPAFSQDITDFENLEEVTEKGFFKSYVGDLFKGFTDLGEPFSMSGGIGVNLRSYNAYGAPLRQDPFFYSLNANLNVRVYKLSLPFSILVSAKNTTSSLPNLRQFVDAFKNNVQSARNRFVRFGTSPQYKWVKLHAGHRTMNFSKFTLANLSFLGVGTELTPGNVRIAAMFGRLAKAEPIDLSLTTPNIPIYERKGWGMKLGYGTDEVFLDFSVFKAMDDPNSIQIPTESPKQVNPEENLVLGINGQMPLTEKLKLKLEVASSALSPNRNDQEAQNKFPHPGFLFQGTTTTLYKNAIETGIDYEGELFSLGVQYKRIDPDFKSLGAYFFNSDIEDYLLKAGFGLFNNVINVNLSGGLQRNNLDNSKPSTLTRYIGSGDVSFSQGNLSIGLNYSNNSSDIAYLVNPELDSLNVIVVTQDAGLNASYSISEENQNQHVISATFNIQQVTDDVENPMESSESRMLVGNLIYSYVLAESQWKFSAKANYNQNELSTVSMKRYGAGMGVSKAFLGGKINSGLDLNYFLITSDAIGDSKSYAAMARTNMKIGSGLNTNLSIGLMRNEKDQNGVKESAMELTGILGLQFTFATKSKPKKEKKKDSSDN